jgi:hypothetical protein
MRFPLLALGLLALPAVADEPALFAGLSGACWRTALDGKGMTDTHCFSTAGGGKLAMDVHKVRDAKDAVIYEGVTVYRPAKQGWVYEYSNGLGNLMTGRAVRAGAELRFWTKDIAGDPDTFWRLGKDGYVVSGEFGETIRTFRRAGQATGGL